MSLLDDFESIGKEQDDSIEFYIHSMVNTDIQPLVFSSVIFQSNEIPSLDNISGGVLPNKTYIISGYEMIINQTAEGRFDFPQYIQKIYMGVWGGPMRKLEMSDFLSYADLIKKKCLDLGWEEDRADSNRSLIISKVLNLYDQDTICSPNNKSSLKIDYSGTNVLIYRE